MSLKNIKRGDSVFIVEQRRASDPVTGTHEVTKAGSKYVTINRRYREDRFHRETGYNLTDYSPTMRAYATEAEWLAEVERSDLSHRVRIQFNRPGFVSSLTTQQLKSVLAAIEPPRLPVDEETDK